MNLKKQKLLELPKNMPSIIHGDFDCSFNKLTSLNGCHKQIKGNFDCSYNKISSLVGCPQKISGLIDLSENLLSTLDGSPKIIKNSLYASANLISTLVGGPKIVYGDFGLLDNKLTDLEGSPREITGFFSLDNNNLTSLFGITPKIGDNLHCNNNNNLTDVSDIWNSHIDGRIYISYNAKLAILPLVKFNVDIKKDLRKFLERNHGSSKQNIINFQYDLIENGFEENAKWKPFSE